MMMGILDPVHVEPRAGYRTETAFSHSSLLRTMQEIFAVEPLLRDASNAASLGEMFTSYP
jgi:hypothetical protein